MSIFFVVSRSPHHFFLLLHHFLSVHCHTHQTTFGPQFFKIFWLIVSFCMSSTHTQTQIHTHSETLKTRQRSSMAVRKLSSPDTLSYPTNALASKMNGNNGAILLNTFPAKSPAPLPSSPATPTIASQQQHHPFQLGRLDGLVSSPNRYSKVRVADSRKISAILLETNVIELQRHLLTITIQNQVSQSTHSAS